MCPSRHSLTFVCLSSLSHSPGKALIWLCGGFPGVSIHGLCCPVPAVWPVAMRLAWLYLTSGCVTAVFNLRATRTGLLSVRPPPYPPNTGPVTMRSAQSHHPDLMTRIIEGLEPPIYFSSDVEPTSIWEEQASKLSPTLAESSLILAEVVDACVHHSIPVRVSVFLSLSPRFDREPTGWLPPLYPPSPHAHQRLTPKSSVSV